MQNDLPSNALKIKNGYENGVDIFKSAGGIKDCSVKTKVGLKTLFKILNINGG
jgi:hypothetical protein